MPKRSGTPRLDAVQNARRGGLESIEATETSLTVVGNPALLSKVMAEMGLRGGLIGGKRRLVTMTAEERSRRASDAAKTRWAKAKKTKNK